jgi:glycosyltransferase involved in cell wall biosynthesis
VKILKTDFSVPEWIKEHFIEFEHVEKYKTKFYDVLRDRLKRFNSDNPDVSIVIPAWNEEKNLLRTLSSLSKLETNYETEIIVINNNSSDKTQYILDKLGVKSFFQPEQSISLTRQMGLEVSKGKYHLCADSDTIYPSMWVDELVEALKNPGVTCVYGEYSFVPHEGMTRRQLAAYEIFSNLLFKLRRKRRDFLNVMGFNFAFRKEDGLKVGGFNTGRKFWSDGWMAMQLAEIGQIKLLKTENTKVWTVPRKMVKDGGIMRTIFKRLGREKTKITEYIFRKKVKHKHPTH